MRLAAVHGSYMRGVHLKRKFRKTEKAGVAMGDCYIIILTQGYAVNMERFTGLNIHGFSPISFTGIVYYLTIAKYVQKNFCSTHENLASLAQQIFPCLQHYSECYNRNVQVQPQKLNHGNIQSYVANTTKFQPLESSSYTAYNQCIYHIW